MTLTARGQVSIGNVQLTTDPTPYETYEWPKRMSEHPGVGGSMTWQDFGVIAKDCVLTLGSGENQMLEKSVVVSLDTMYRTKGGTYTLTDWLGNEFTVLIRNFKPTPTFLGTLYTYTMTLRVTAITKLFGSTYQGS